MESYVEQARELPIVGRFDVVIVGGGVAGVAAAIAAARNGASTLLIERFGYFGGTATASLMANINAFRNQKKPDNLQTSRGIAQEIILEMHKIGGLGNATSYEQEEYNIEEGELSYSYPIDTEKFKYVTLKMVHEAGVTILFHTYFADTIMDDNTLKGIIVENKSGRSAILAKVVIDASGDADVAFRAGVPFWQVEKDEAPRLGDQLMYRVTGFPTEEKLPQTGPVASGFMNVWGPSAPHLNGSDAQDLSREEVETRLKVYDHFAALKQQRPYLQNAVIADTGPLIGVRQTRFIEGEYKLQVDDILQDRRFPDVIALCSSPIIHFYGYRRYLEHAGYDIPYRCLVPQKVDNLLVTGRCMSSDQPSYESWRAMAPIMSISEAAGVAAAISCRDDVTPRKVDVKKVQAALVAQGAELGQNRR